MDRTELLILSGVFILIAATLGGGYLAVVHGYEEKFGVFV
jgi:hypothetical protein